MNKYEKLASVVGKSPEDIQKHYNENNLDAETDTTEWEKLVSDTFSIWKTSQNLECSISTCKKSGDGSAMWCEWVKTLANSEDWSRQMLIQIHLGSDQLLGFHLEVSIPCLSLVSLSSWMDSSCNNYN